MNPKLLIAEANVEYCDLYGRFAAECGYEVETASDGLSCVEKLRQFKPEVLVLDLELTWGGGDGVLAWLRERKGSLDVRVVLTAVPEGSEAIPGDLEPPIVGFLPKPFLLVQLLDQVRSALADKIQVEPDYLQYPNRHSELFIG
jgi:DNA-binding response OmpR family regulator